MSISTVHVATSRPYSVHIGAGLLERVQESIAPDIGCAVLTDDNVERLYGQALTGLVDRRRLAVTPGESSKSFGVLERVLDFLLDAELDRASRLVALGGGVVGDLGGLAASLFQRGVEFVQCPTTLLAQVDSSVGGKTAVNLAGGKNLAGTFHQPCAVYADTRTLQTLSDDEYRSGLGEVIKSALLGDAALLERLESDAKSIAERDPDVMRDVVEACVRVKADVVARDEREGGPRKALNLGHTFGHAIEHAAGYGTVPHGVAVGVGLALAADCAQRVGLAQEAELLERVERLLERYEMPASLGQLTERYGCALEEEALMEGMRHDKKGLAGRPRFVLPTRAGKVEIDVEVDPDLIGRLWARTPGVSS